MDIQYSIPCLLRNGRQVRYLVSFDILDRILNNEVKYIPNQSTLPIRNAPNFYSSTTQTHPHE
ncbi:MAG: hypothetical protein DWQ02_09470 [Bacteroidetes bacterium]|nr:MAG: hypothetical protein DWQ02_09470 [Bacteroidota bacterium]